ncbi:winged helix DNA-binding domain-containing protein [Streptomyces sp. H27-D2]|uniref:winged helix DNA-binding domain-containing protein n=1 Tax=Streptomyces sp. H27-D2 TaxID=3046304 RepID=UPI002DBC19FA|nr:winged helix DNA-binding domain-containing protein [Streptomyces sp. H27-D2]MEC4017329.1 winged helix DNA-binding domain-containing protein [Streptomyces sp. H27-D2]
MPALSVRTLNRTLLERQWLVSRSSRTALDAVEHLVAVQGQDPDAPYVGLWTRLADFRHDDLAALLHDRSVVRGAVVRTTQHLLAADDFRWLRPLVQPMLDRSPRQGFGKEIAGLDLAELATVAREEMAGRTLTRPELGRLLAKRFPGRHASALAGSAHFLLALLHPPPSGLWGNRGSVPCVLAEDWLGGPLEAAPRVETMIKRYLVAFGPAGVMDIQAWSGLTRLREVVEGLRGQLRVYRDEAGKELYDLPDARLADPGLAVPARFLPAFDNLVLGHADRTRVISDGDRKAVAPGQAMVRPTFLVDGFVRGTWAVDGDRLRVSPFRPLSAADTAAVLAEAESLRDFVAAGGGSGREVVFD